MVTTAIFALTIVIFTLTMTIFTVTTAIFTVTITASLRNPDGFSVQIASFGVRVTKILPVLHLFEKYLLDHIRICPGPAAEHFDGKGLFDLCKLRVPVVKRFVGD